MKIHNILSLALFVAVLSGVIVRAESKINEWSQPILINLSTDGGEIQAVIQHYINGCLVFVPEKQLLWLGRVIPQEHQKYICLSNTIVRIATGNDMLFINRQAIRLHGTPKEQAQAKAKIIADFEKQIKDDPKYDDIRIRLGEVLLGAHSLSPFLPPPERVRPARAATISDIQVEHDNITVTLVGENNIKVVLVFDNSMNIIKGMIGDEVSFPSKQQSKPGKK